MFFGKKKNLDKYIPHGDFEQKKSHLRVRDLFYLSLRIFRVKKARTLLTILGISMGIGTVLFLVSLGYGLQYLLIGKLATTEDSLISIEVYYPSESNLQISNANIGEVSSYSEHAETSAVAENFGEARTGEFSGSLLMRFVQSNYFRLSGQKPDTGSIFSDDENAIVMSNIALKLFGLTEEDAVGKEVKLSIYYQSENSPEVSIIEPPQLFKIKGVITDDDQPPYIFVPYVVLGDKIASFQRMFVKAKNIDSVAPLSDKLIDDGYLISARLDLVNQAKSTMNIVTIVLGIFGGAALIVSAIGMFNTMVIGFLERIFEVGIMKAIGATSKDIRNLFLMESIIIGFLGGVGGIGVGVLGGEVFNFLLNLWAEHLGGSSVRLFVYPMKFIFFIIILSSCVGLLSGMWPARRASSLSPKEAFLRR